MRQDYRKPEPVRVDRNMRRCLMCLEQFLSDGRHNRICRRCRSSQAWRDGY